MDVLITDVGRASGIRDDDADRLDAAVRACVASGSTPSCQVALARNGEVLLSGVHGSARAEDRYIIYSATKPVVAAAAMALLAREGVAVTTPVAALVPAFSNKPAVTLEQVFTHTSGFPSPILPRDAWGDRVARERAMVEWSLECEPGTRFLYHGSSAHWVLVEVIERLSGQRYQDVVNHDLLAPMRTGRMSLGAGDDDDLGLPVVATGEPVSPAEAARVRGTAEAASPEHFLAYNAEEVRRFGSPSSGCIADAVSLARFYQCMLNGSDGLWRHVDSEDVTRRIRMDLPVPGLGATAARSLGWMVSGRERTQFRHRFGDGLSTEAFGHAGAGGQVSWADPASGCSFALLSNAIDRDVVREHQTRHAASTAAAAIAARLQ